MTEIGIPDPLEPAIEVIPLVDPVPSPLEVPAAEPEPRPQPVPA